MGDFNEITSQDEKCGSSVRPHKQIEEFRQALKFNGLLAFGWKGHKYIWSNRHEDVTSITERLDIAMANKEWYNRIGYREVKILISGISNYLSLL